MSDASKMDTMWNREWTHRVLGLALEEARTQFESQTWEAFELYGRRGVPCEEVARQLGMSQEAVRHAKSRVARTLRQIIDRIRDEEG